MKIIILDIILCLLNLVMAFLNYEKKYYKAAMLNCFLAGAILLASMMWVN